MTKPYDRKRWCKMAETATKRNLGLDLLRMVAMFMVAVLHVLGAGGVLNSATPLSPDYVTAWLLETAAFCAVNCYALLSGYVGLRGRFRYANLALLWCQAAFYTIGIPLVFAAVKPGSVGAKELIRGFFPAMSNHYWYFTAYFAMFFFIPAFNFLVEKLERHQMKALAVSLVVLFSVLPTVFQSDVAEIFPGDLFIEYGGYSPLWLAVLYILGAYARKYECFARVKWWKALGIYALCVLVTWGEKWLVEGARMHFLGAYIPGGILVSYTSPTMLLAALALLAAFAKMPVPKWAARPIGFFAPMAFSVYLIHVHPLMWQHVMWGRFAAFGSYGTVKLALFVLGTAMGIYLGCSVIDCVRAWLFRRLRLRERLVRLEGKWLGGLWVDE